MKAENAERAAGLVRALGALPEMAKLLRVTGDGPEPAEMREMEIAVGRWEADGSGGSDLWLHLDPAMALLLLPKVEKLIRDELRDLGVVLADGGER